MVTRNKPAKSPHASGTSATGAIKHGSADAITVNQDATLVTCAQLMHDTNAGCLIVTGLRSGHPVPLGVLTDRDITVEVVAFSLDPNVITAGDIMTRLPAP
jgi:predicted transcriptional regulator